MLANILWEISEDVPLKSYLWEIEIERIAFDEIRINIVHLQQIWFYRSKDARRWKKEEDKNNQLSDKWFNRIKIHKTDKEIIR